MDVQIPADLSEFVADEAGYSVSGVITTDGAIGNLSVTDIQSWAFNVWEANGSLVYSETGGWQDVGERGGYGPGSTLLEATPTQLLLPATYYLSLDNSRWSYLAWANDYSVDTYPYIYSCGWENGIDNGVFWNTDSPQMNGSEPWVIAQAATVPEPSTIMLLFTGGVALLAHVWRKSRR
jgi:hypothetical protein